MTRLVLPFVLFFLCGRATASPVDPPTVTSRRVQPLLGVGRLPVPSETVPVTAEALFDDTGKVQEIQIEINTKDWAALKENYLANTYYPADLRWNGQVVRNIGVRSRGTSTRSPEKPSLRIDFNRYTTGQTFLGLKSLLVKNNLTDPSSMHERIAMQFFQRMGIQTSREASVRLVVNGVYDGLYTLVEAPDQDFVQRTLGESDGYLYKFDRNFGDEPYYFEYLGADPASYVPHHWQPQTHASDPHPEPIVEMIRIATQSSGSAFPTDIGHYLDLVAVVRHVAIENYLAEPDGFLGGAGMNNFYIYRLQNQLLHVLIPWDKSETFRDGPAFDILNGIENIPDSRQNRLWARIWQFAELRRVYFDTLLECATSASALVEGDTRTWMEREIDREFEQIKADVQLDPQTPYFFQDFLAGVDAMRAFAAARAEYVRTEVGRRRH